jgi:stage V sporulation protein R
MDYKLSDLEVWDERICEIAKGYGLNWFDIQYEFIDYQSMIGAMAFHGMPSHYNHWSFGKSYERTLHSYNTGATGLPYELIINSDPSLAYMMRENPLYLQVLIMAHCVGHSDFFKNNRTFKDTRPDTILGRSRSAKKRFQSYVEDPSIGIEKVEAAIDSCHAIQFQIQRPGWIRRTREEIIDDYKQILKEDPTTKEIDLTKNPLEHDYDILGFISENAKIPSWKRDIIDVCRDEGKYFWPQMQTKIINEGFACLTHFNILHDLNLPAELHIPFIKSHNQVVCPHIGGINPYHLGFHLFQKIKERHGIGECLLAREVHNDASFISQYLTREDCEELNLFSYSKRWNGDSVVDDVSDEDGWKIVKRDLVNQVGGSSIPILYVKDIRRDGTMFLGHEHDGRDLDTAENRYAMEHIRVLWENPVVLNTQINKLDLRFEV